MLAHAILPSDPIQLRLVAATLLARIDAQEAAAVVQQEALAERDAELARRAAIILGQNATIEALKDVICQGSCPVTQAAFFSFLSSCLTGLSHTVAGRSQFRVVPRQRPGLAALAFS